MPVQQTEFVLHFDGPVPDEHQIAAEDLGKALIGMHELVNAAIAANGMRLSDVSLRATTNAEGSWETYLQVAQSIPEHVITMATGSTAQALERIVNIIVGGGAMAGGVYGLAKWQRGKRSAHKRPAQPDDADRFPDINIEGNNNSVNVQYVIVQNDDGDEQAWPRQVVETYESSRGRRALQKSLEPLLGDDVDLLELRSSTDSQAVTADEAAEISRNIGAPEGLRENETVERMKLQLVSLNYRPGRKWSFFDGRSTISVSMRDEVFMRRVDLDEVHIGKGYIFDVDLLVRSWWQEGDMKSERAVVRVYGDPVRPDLS